MSSITIRIPIQCHWKKSPPNAHVLSLIHQVHYELEFDENKNDGMLDIFEVNILKLIHSEVIGGDFPLRTYRLSNASSIKPTCTSTPSIQSLKTVLNCLEAWKPFRN